MSAEEVALIVTAGKAMYGLDTLGGLIAGENLVVTAGSDRTHQRRHRHDLGHTTGHHHGNGIKKVVIKLQ